MSDGNNERLELPQTPAWLNTTIPAVEPEPPAVAPSPEAASVAAEPEPAGAPGWTLGDMPAGPPAPGSGIEGDPIPELAPPLPTDPRILEFANGLIQFKRFWTMPAGTSNEMDAATAFATMIVGIVDNEKSAPEEIADAQPQQRRTRRKSS